MKEFKTVKSNRDFGFNGFVFAESLDSKYIYEFDNYQSDYYIKKVVEHEGLFLCYCDLVVISVAGRKYVTNPDWPVAKFGLGDRVILHKKEDIITACSSNAPRPYEYSLLFGGAWHKEKNLKLVEPWVAKLAEV